MRGPILKLPLTPHGAQGISIPNPKQKRPVLLLGGTFDGQLLPPTPSLGHRRVEGNLKGVGKEGMMVDELWEYWSFERTANVGDMSDEGGGTWSHLFVLWAA